MYRLIFIVALFSFIPLVKAIETYQAPTDFLNDVFENNIPKVKKIWITGKVKEQVSKILRHPPNSLRTRYWRSNAKSVWILNEVGKTQDITVGIVVVNNRIERIKVLVFRESRGGEVRHSFFTDQFKNIGLQMNMQLSKNIDGITGATLSVRALKKVAALALYLDAKIRE